MMSNDRNSSFQLSFSGTDWVALNSLTIPQTNLQDRFTSLQIARRNSTRTNWSRDERQEMIAENSRRIERRLKEHGKRSSRKGKRHSPAKHACVRPKLVIIREDDEDGRLYQPQAKVTHHWFRSLLGKRTNNGHAHCASQSPPSSVSSSSSVPSTKDDSVSGFHTLYQALTSYMHGMWHRCHWQIYFIPRRTRRTLVAYDPENRKVEWEIPTT